MTERVEQILAANRARPIDGDVVRTALLEIRNDQELLLALLRRLMDECNSTSTGWLIPAICGWLTADTLAQAAATARRHLREHDRCDTAEDVLQHESLRRPPANLPPTLHIAFPERVVREWWDRWPLRTGHPTWVVWASDQHQATVGGAAECPCPRCHGPGESLLGISGEAVEAIKSRDFIEFVWCPVCSPFTQATYGLVDNKGRTTLMDLNLMIELEISCKVEPIPRTEVGLADLGSEWRVQDWMWSNNVENLHRVGGLPTWIQFEATPECSRCAVAMAFVGQIAVSDLVYGEGMAYLHWCDNCSVTAVVYQQT